MVRQSASIFRMFYFTKSAVKATLPGDRVDVVVVRTLWPHAGVIRAVRGWSRDHGQGPGGPPTTVPRMRLRLVCLPSYTRHVSKVVPKWQQKTGSVTLADVAILAVGRQSAGEEDKKDERTQASLSSRRPNASHPVTVR